MDVDDEAIGLVRAHRWASAAVQKQRLRGVGCARIFDLDKEKRSDMERIAGRRRTLLVYAFLLANPDKTRGMLADLVGVLERIKARGGTVVDVDSGLSSEANEKAFRAVVADQVRRHNQGDKSADNHPKGTPGRQEDEFSRGDLRLAHHIWHNPVDYPTWDSAAEALKRIKATNTGRPFTKERAHKKWGPRPKCR